MLRQEAEDFELSHPWRVPLDETSEVVLLGVSVHNLFLRISVGCGPKVAEEYLGMLTEGTPPWPGWRMGSAARFFYPVGVAVDSIDLGLSSQHYRCSR